MTTSDNKKKKVKKQESLEEMRWMLRGILHGLVDDIYRGYMSDKHTIEIWHIKIEDCLNRK